MYEQHFGLQQEPFSIAPDPHFLFLSDQHREALAHLLYGVGGGGGFVLLTGEIGAGKTTVCRCFLEQIPAHCNVAYIFNPQLTVAELLQTICEEFRVEVPASAAEGAARGQMKEYVDALNGYLLAAHAQGRSAVLIIDEAQSLSAAVLEQLRLLTNLETAERKLLQIILIGQPELREMLAHPGLEQLAQRVIARYHLGALSAADTVRYVHHRLAVAGGGPVIPMEPQALVRLYQLTGGVPRRINLLAGRALLGAYAQGRETVDPSMLDAAAQEVFGDLAPRAVAGPGGAVRAGLDRTAMLALLAATAVAFSALTWWAVRDRVQGPALAPAMGAARAASTPAPGAGPGGATSATPSTAPDPALASATVASSGSSSSSNSGPAAAQPAAAGPAGLLGGTAAPAVPNVQSSSGADGAVGSANVEPGALLAAAWADEAEAWRVLAKAWGVAPTDSVCAPSTVATTGLACYRAKGGIALVRQMARPGVVLLRLRDEAPVYAVMESLDEREAVLRTGARRWRVPLSVLANLWRGGEFATLWKVPPGWRERDAADASTQAAVRAWLHRQLANSGGDKPTLALRERIAAFQSAHGLVADGKASPVTLMQVNRVAGVEEPRLLAVPAATAALGP